VLHQIVRHRPPPPTGPSLRNLDDAVPTRFVETLLRVSAGLDRLGVPHLLLGGIAVGVHGHPRTTRDVDFLIGTAGCVRIDGLLYPSEAVLALIDREVIPVDTLVLRDPDPQLNAGFAFELDAMLASPFRAGGVPIAPIELIVGTKLLRQKAQDVADIVELAQLATFDRDRVRAFVARCLRPPLPDDLERMLAQADRERSLG
jgi:hypothetical protein